MAATRTSTQNNLKKLIGVVVLIAAVIAAGLWYVSRYVANPELANFAHLKIGSEVPNLPMNRFPDGQKNLAEVAGKITMINFWATWCESCMVEMPSIVSLYERFKGRGFQVLGVNLDENPRAVVPETLSEFGMKFPVFTDLEGSVGEAFNVQAIPLTVIFDSNRKVLFIEKGERDWDTQEVRQQIETWLK